MYVCMFSYNEMNLDLGTLPESTGCAVWSPQTSAIMKLAMASNLAFESLMWETVVDVSAHKRELTKMISPSLLLCPPNPLTSAFPNFLFMPLSFSFSFTRVNSVVFLFWFYTVAKIKTPLVD